MVASAQGIVQCRGGCFAARLTCCDCIIVFRRGVDEKAARILGGLQLHLLPSMNPDGFADHSRNNR